MQQNMSLDDQLKIIQDFCSKFLAFFKDTTQKKSLDFYLSKECQALEAQYQKAFPMLRSINASKNTKYTSEEDKKKIANLEEYMKTIKAFSTFQRFSASQRQSLLSKRAFAPQEFAMIGSWSPTDDSTSQQGHQFLVATCGIATCVGVSFYCPQKHSGMVAHLDSDHNDESHLEAYFLRLLDEMSIIKLDQLHATIVISISNHEGLDQNIIKVFKKLLGHQHITSFEQKTVNETNADLLLNLKNGNVLTQYTEVIQGQESGLKPGNQLADALNMSEGFKLFHLKNGEIYEQAAFDVSSTYSLNDRNCMTPCNKSTESSPAVLDSFNSRLFSLSAALAESKTSPAAPSSSFTPIASHVAQKGVQVNIRVLNEKAKYDRFKRDHRKIIEKCLKNIDDFTIEKYRSFLGFQNNNNNDDISKILERFLQAQTQHTRKPER